MLHAASYKVNVAIPDEKEKFSTDFNLNLVRLRESGIVPASLSEACGWTPAEDSIIIDALFGSGLSKPVTGIMEEVINCINSMKGIVVAIDIPSGLFADIPAEKGAVIVHSDYTLSFQMPKLAFLFSENEIFTGEWQVLPIGLNEDFIAHEPCNQYLVTREALIPLRKLRSRFAHKGTFGHALLISGSYGKMGAAVLASESCLRSGTGLLTTHIPQCGYSILQTAVPEAMVSLDRNDKSCSQLPDLSAYSAIGIGPGIGKSEETTSVLKLLLQEAKVPLVMDADALNILSENKTWLAFIPGGSVLTPHPKEFERLAGTWKNSFEMIRILKEFTLKYQVYVILKGAYTAISTPGGSIFFNPTGNPGMATGGSGDVLTGIILGLLAQRYSSVDACLLGVYLHGLAGDLAAAEYGFEAMLAGDITRNLGKAFLKFEMEQEMI
jgi:NAD(P)H-hydrate epimerase